MRLALKIARLSGCAVIGALFLLFISPVQAAGLVLNEIFANPVNEDYEFIELYNPSGSAITLTGYKISDLVKTYTIPEATISAKSFFTLKKSQTNIRLNNDDAETVTLKDKNDNPLDSFSYDGTVEETSFSRVPDGGSWLAETPPTENAANQAPPTPSPSPTPEPSPSPTPTPTPTPSPSPSSSPSPLASPITSPSPDLEDSVNSEEMLASLGGEILGATETAEASSSEEASQSAKPISPYWLSGGLTLAGLIMLGLTIRSWYKV